MFGEKLTAPIRIAQITDPQTYYQAIHGSQLICQVLDQDKNTIARGYGMSWNEQYQMNPVMEFGHKYCVEIVKGAMPPGQINMQMMYFLHLNDALPTQDNLVTKRELTVLIQITPEHEDVNLRGLVLDVFQGVVIQGQQGNWNSQALYLRNASMLYRTRTKGIEWATSNNLKYPAKAGESISFDFNLANNREITSL